MTRWKSARISDGVLGAFARGCGLPVDHAPHLRGEVRAARVGETGHPRFEGLAPRFRHLPRGGRLEDQARRLRLRPLDSCPP